MEVHKKKEIAIGTTEKIAAVMKNFLKMRSAIAGVPDNLISL